jgi:hypothetical protein
MFTKKTVVVLVIVAVVLVLLSVTLNSIESNKKVPQVTNNVVKPIDTKSGEVGVVVLPTDVEDKNV